MSEIVTLDDAGTRHVVTENGRQQIVVTNNPRNTDTYAEGNNDPEAVLKTAALEKADFGDERFDKVFAFNVAPFWHQPKEALGIVRRHLAPDGAVYLFWDARHTQPGRAPDLADQLVGIAGEYYLHQRKK